MEHFGILTGISWNSYGWNYPASKEDLRLTQYESAKINKIQHEDLNFAHYDIPAEKDGWFIGYSPLMNAMPALKFRKEVKIIILRSHDYRQNQNFIVGYYLFPEIDHYKRAQMGRGLNKYSFGNFRSKPEHICLLHVPVPFNSSMCIEKKLLPEGKEMANRKFNYLSKANVENILQLVLDLNPGCFHVNKTIELLSHE
jgi:5-methylcytosine-specific restriction protein A